MSLRSWFAPLGGVQAELLWRGYGLCALLLALLLRGDDPLAIYARVFPWQLHATTLCGLALALLGPRLVLLVATAAAWLAFVGLVIAGTDARVAFVADEYLAYAALPLLGALSAATTLLRRGPADAAELDVGQAALFRVAIAASLGFAALHKLNADFLDPVSSCATMLAKRLEVWSLPVLRPPPALVIALEAGALLLLLRWPRVGIACTLLLAAGLGHVGPVAFNGLLAVGSLAFLPRADVQGLAARWRPALAIAAALVLLAAPLSLRLYQGRAPWAPYYALEALLLAVAVIAAACPRTGERSPAPTRAQRRLRGLAIAAALVCGFAPYLGLQHRFGFAMLSNLRVDDDRWNSVVVPRAVRLGASDLYVHVLEVRTDAAWLKPPKDPAREPTVVPGVFAPQEFRRRVEENRRRRLRVGAVVRYRGEQRVFEDLLYDGAAQAFVAALPVRRTLQPALRLSRRQPCVH